MYQSYLGYKRKSIVIITLFGALVMVVSVYLIQHLFISDKRSSFDRQDAIYATVTIVGSQSDELSSTLLSRASGVLFSPDGLVLTAKHSVEYDGSYKVFNHQGSVYTVSQIWLDPERDLAVLQIRDGDGLKPRKLPFVSFSAAEAVSGPINALGYTYTNKDIIVLTGDIIGYHDMMYELAVSLQPGMSGGPVFTQDGKLIAINRAVNTHNSTQSFALSVTKEMIQGFLDKNMTL